MSTDDDRLEELTERYLQLLRNGRAPSVREFAEQYPDLRDDLEDLLPLLADLDGQKEGPAAADPAQIPLPFRLGPEFTLTKRIGVGGMGTVFEATQESLGRRCAVKILSEQTSAHTDELRERFARESQILARLRHPNIVTVHGAGKAAGFSYYAMDLVEGPTLESLCRTPDDIARIGIQVAAALDYAHGYGIFHCDIKPSNLLPEADGNIRVADFGLARLRAVSVKDGGGTRRYMAPERLKQNVCSAGTDQYALGLTLHELLDGTFPVTADTDRELERKLAEEPLPPPKKAPPELAAILRKMTARNPDDRYSSVYHAAEDLRRFLDRRPVSAYAAPPLYRLRLCFRRAPVRSALLTLAAVTLLVLPAVLGTELTATRRALSEETGRRRLASRALEAVFGAIADTGATPSNARITDSLSDYFPQMLEKRLLPTQQLPEICRLFGTVAGINERFDVAETAMRRLFEEAPGARAGNLYADVLYRQGRKEDGHRISRLVIARYGNLTDTASRCETLLARLRLPQTEWGPAETQLRSLLKDRPNHPNTLMLCAWLGENHPGVLARALNRDPAPTPLTYYRQLLLEYPNRSEFSTAMLNYGSRFLTEVSVEEAKQYCDAVEFGAIEAIYLRKNHADDFAAQAAVKTYVKALVHWIRRTHPVLRKDMDYRRCICSIAVLHFLPEFPADVTIAIARAHIGLEPEDRTAENNLREAEIIRARVDANRPLPGVNTRLYDALRKNPEWKDLRKAGTNFDQPVRQRRKELLRRKKNDRRTP